MPVPLVNDDMARRNDRLLLRIEDIDAAAAGEYGPRSKICVGSGSPGSRM
jgi:hypothetical protein